MPIYRIRGIDVDFPFDAYDCQLVYMDKVLQSLQEGSNALLESPTGTGKTLCLLCATLAWRRSFGEFLRGGGGGGGGGSQPCGSQKSGETPSRPEYPVIIYASRTHSQLKQVIKELKASNYRPKMAVLGSREQMCIHDEVRQIRGKVQNNACHYLCKKRRCRHQNLVTDYLKNNSELGNEPFDIEDLVNIGRTSGPCPYYISRDLSKSVDILFAPYNYLIDPGNRRSLTGIPWSNAVLIFDEAHNLESICAEAASFDLPSTYLTSCIAEAKQCIDICVAKRSIEKSADKQFDPDSYAILKALLMKLEKRISEVVIESKESGFTRPGSYIYEFLSDLNITYETSKMLIDTIDNASLLLEEGNSAESGAPVKTKGTVCRLETIRDILDIIFRGGSQTHAKFYRFHVDESQQKFGDSLKGKGSRILSWWCFNPGLAMEEFVKLGVRSIILTSGTLSPLDSFAMELNLEFPVRLENPHVISPNQIWVGVMPVGPSGHPLNSSYRTRDSLEYKQELGNAIVNFARIVPDGLLVFFPSYYMMDKCIECWKSKCIECRNSMNLARSVDFSTTWDRICKYKQPVVEPRQSSHFPDAIEDYVTKLRDSSTSGAIFFAVCRGKVSEGLDFADRAGRAVLITGMPFSTTTDPKVRLKREYLDKQSTSLNKNTKGLTGEEWYVQQAARAVNQAVGRVIRHRHDYGAIIYCDERFARQNHQYQMSYWLRPHIKNYSNFGEVVRTLTKFFRDKVSSDSLKGKQTNCIDNIAIAKEKNCPRKFLTNLASSLPNEPRNFSLSVNAADSSSSYSQLAWIAPANRSTLSTKHSYMSVSQLASSGDKLSQDTQVVDLTIDSPSHGLLAEHAFKSLGLKKRKTVDRAESDPDHGNLSSKLIDSVDSGALAENKVAEPTPPSKSVSIQQGCEKEENIQEKSPPSGSQDSKIGFAFLKQVQGKLSAAEYKEFIGLMKALKSKAMSTKDSLEAIANLFSSPGRLPLLEGFTFFVPKNHLSAYGQLVKRHSAGAKT